MFAPPVTAQTSENLDWGVEVVDMFYFNIDYWEGISVDINEDFYCNVTGPIPTIPDPVSSFIGIPDVPLTIEFLNATTMGLLLMFITFAMKVTVPTGNWSLMTELVEDVSSVEIGGDTYSIQPDVILDDCLHWGFTYNLTTAVTDNVIKVVYLKSDGLLAYLNFDAYILDSSTMYGEIDVVRDGTVPVITSPADISYNETDVGNQILWSATDQSPAAYILYKDDVEIKRGLWNSSSENIVVDIDGLAIGSFDYEIEFYEASGLNASDVVTVTVNESPAITTSDTTATGTSPSDTGTGLVDFLTENLTMILGVGGGVVILIIVIVALRKK